MINYLIKILKLLILPFFIISMFSNAFSKERFILCTTTSTFDSGLITYLNDNFVDYWPRFLRFIIWAPLNINQDTQFLLMGVLVGLVMGGAQALGRSLFAYMSPKS